MAANTLGPRPAPGEANLASYKICFRTDTDIELCVSLAFGHDRAAVEFVRSKSRHDAVQIWQGQRFVGEVRAFRPLFQGPVPSGASSVDFTHSAA